MGLWARPPQATLSVEATAGEEKTLEPCGNSMPCLADSVFQALPLFRSHLSQIVSVSVSRPANYLLVWTLMLCPSGHILSLSYIFPINCPLSIVPEYRHIQEPWKNGDMFPLVGSSQTNGCPLAIPELSVVNTSDRTWPLKNWPQKQPPQASLPGERSLEELWNRVLLECQPTEEERNVVKESNMSVFLYKKDMEGLQLSKSLHVMVNMIASKITQQKTFVLSQNQDLKLFQLH